MRDSHFELVQRLFQAVPWPAAGGLVSSALLLTVLRLQVNRPIGIAYADVVARARLAVEEQGYPEGSWRARAAAGYVVSSPTLACTRFSVSVGWALSGT